MPCYKVKTFARNFYSIKQGPSITDITRADVSIDWQADKHSHPWTEITFVTGGSGRIVLGKRVYPIIKGDLIIINPGLPHYEEYRKKDSKNSRLCFFCCCVEDFETSMMPRNHLLPTHYPPILKTGEMEEKFLSAFVEIFEEHKAGQEWYADICKNLSYEIVMLTLRLLHEKYNLSLQWQNDRNIDRIRQFIDRHFTEKISSKIIAQELAMSRQSLYRLLQKGNFFLGQYISHKRMEFAKQQIIETNTSLQDIAYMSGYSDYSSFFTFFKKQVGVSPNEYRNFYGLDKAVSQ
ncbi:MAG: AraC family transcriptional regulator [Treponema sp.]|jgi:AraC-like DNA-binding protein/mannose-6-phosphate isomerase-like protein (cupin superfamily)|nr:AraC family transcriptional regulator [Treponema sp.]